MLATDDTPGFWLRARCADNQTAAPEGGGAIAFEQRACLLRGAQGKDLLQKQEWLYVPREENEHAQAGLSTAANRATRTAKARKREAVALSATRAAAYLVMPIDELIAESGGTFWLHVEGDSTIMRAEKEELVLPSQK